LIGEEKKDGGGTEAHGKGITYEPMLINEIINGGATKSKLKKGMMFMMCVVHMMM